MYADNHIPKNGQNGQRDGTTRARWREDDRHDSPRIALYSHDTQGLGHIRRNLLITRALCRNGATPTILLLSGIREAGAFVMPAGVDCLTLPSLGKGVDGQYFPRSLGVSMTDLIKVRSKAIAATLQSFEPDVLIVDKVPRGVHDELMPILEWLRASERTRMILGLREILDDPDTVQREWMSGEYESTINNFYDRIWVYGDQKIFDPVREYGFSDRIARMVRFSGYLNPRDIEDGAITDVGPADSTGADEKTRPDRTLCLVGGGGDGLDLAEAFVRANHPGEGVLVTGPRMPVDALARLHALAAMRPNIQIHEFVTEPCPLIARADRVIAMGGYNTICEILAYEKPALIVPRTEPRTEQLIRATRFAALGLVEMMRPEQLSAGAISSWLSRATTTTQNARSIMDFGGVSRLPSLLQEAITSTTTNRDSTRATV